jgi:hypothetical protein
LTCSHCGVRTLHIVSGMENRNDPYDYGVTRCGTLPHLDAPRADAQQLDTVAVLEAIGVRPVYVETLGLDALILLKHHLVLVDADLSPERMTRVVEQALKAALDRNGGRR